MHKKFLTFLDSKRNEGLTLVETMVAIVILIFAITGPLLLAYNGISFSRLSRDHTTAIFLAQDAIEFVVAAKEYNIDSSILNNWLINLDDCASGCIVDTTKNVSDATSVEPCAGVCPQLLFSEGKYRHTGALTEATPFVRKIIIEPVPDNPGERKVTAIVSFQSGFFTKLVSLKTNIYQISI